MSKDQLVPDNRLRKFNVSTEEELQQFINNCKSALENTTVELHINSGKSMGNDRKDDISLEKVLRDMTHVLYDLKNGISLVKSDKGKESLHNIEKELEKIYRKQEEIIKKKEEEAKKKADEAAKKAKKPNNPPKPINKGQVKKQGSMNGPKQGSNKTPRVNSEANRVGEFPVAVKNLKFPVENNQNINATSASAKSPSKEVKSRSPSNSPTLRKPSPNTAVKKVVSVPPPREIYNPLGIIKDEVEAAIREKKTFTIRGVFPAVRRALLKRGWIEKYHPNYRDKSHQDDMKRFLAMSVGELVDLLRNKNIAPSLKNIIKSKLLKDHQVDLYWDHTFDVFKECPDAKKLTLINRFRRESVSYTTKQGLCQAARDAHWLQIPGIARINHPRCYVLTKGGDTKSFLKDFGLTAAISLLKWVVKNNITGESKIVSETGKIPMKAFDFAIAECYKHLKKINHKDIDEEIKEALEVEWSEFLDQFYKAVHVGNHFKQADKNRHPSQEAKDMVRKSNYLLNQLREFMPCLDMDGYMNIWILKPTNSSRGQGIHICRTLQFILDIVRKNPNRRYVIQKYIERPLLIHDTKFDIRQWFLVTSASPLTIWMYKRCYLRFSSQTYNLRKLHESIHLTNNSVQSKYLHYKNRDPLLPSCGMWDSKQFKSYLSDIGYPSVFEDTIYPGMKECITGAMIAHRDKIDRRKNCFELYGADFMLAETFEPWLLEINSNPALHASTPVTAKLCPEVLEDVIKVVVDNARNPKADTGSFELIYTEKLENQTANINQKFEITGTPLPDDYFSGDAENEIVPNASPLASKDFETPDAGKVLIQTTRAMKEALKNLLEFVKREKLKRRSRKEKSMETAPGVDDSFCQTNSELISLFQSQKVLVNSDHSEKCVTFSS